MIGRTGTMAGLRRVRPWIPDPPESFVVDVPGCRGDEYSMHMPLRDFSDDALREIGREWTEALLARAAEQRAEGGAS